MSQESKGGATHSLKQRVVSSMKWTGGSALITAVLQILQLSVLAHLLDPADFGLVGMIAVLVGFAQMFADMGISNAIILHREVLDRQLSSLYGMSLIIGIALYLLMLILSPAVAAFYNEPRLSGLMAWLSLTFLITPFGQQFQILLQKELKFAAITSVEVLAITLSCIVAIAIALAGWGVGALVAAQIAGTCVRTAGFMVAGRSIWSPSLRFSLKDLRGFMSFGLYQMGERTLSYLAANLDKLLIGKILGVEALGLYSVAYQLMIRPKTLFNPIITRIAFPAFASIQNDDPRLRRGYLRMIRWIAFLNLPIYLGMIAAAAPLVSLFLGPDWSQAAPLLQAMCLLGILLSLSNPIGSLLLAKGRADIGFWMNVVILAFDALAIWIGSFWGISGIAWMLVAVNWILLFPFDVWIKWYLIRMEPREYIRSFTPSMGLATMMALVVTGFDHLVTFPSATVHLLALIALGVLSYAALVFVLQRSLVLESWQIVAGRL